MREHDFDPDERSGQVAARMLAYIAGACIGGGAFVALCGVALWWAIERGGS